MSSQMNNSDNINQKYEGKVFNISGKNKNESSGTFNNSDWILFSLDFAKQKLLKFKNI